MAGEILKKRREDLGLDIRETADLLKIKAAYLVAIENDTFAELPAPVYTMGYIRCYAKYLDVDAESIIEHYTKNLSQPGHTTIIPVAYSQKKVPKIYYVIFCGVCALAAFFFVSHGRSKPKETVKAPSGSVQVQEVVRPRINPLPSNLSKAERPPANHVPAAPLPAGGGGQHGAEHHLEIKATATTWISIRLDGGKTEEQTLKPGESKEVRFPDKALLRIGNAGGIRVVLDEKDLGVAGTLGQVMTLSLPPEKTPSPVTSP